MSKEPLFPHVPKSKEPQFPHTPSGKETSSLIEAVRETADTLSSSRYIVSKLDSWTPEQKMKYIKAYSASDWDVVYDMTSDMGGSQYWRNLTRGSLCDVLKEGKPLDLLASTEGDPIRKFCCSICGECAPEELLEEGEFLLP